MKKPLFLLGVILASIGSVAYISSYQFVLGDHGFEHDTCTAVSLADCKVITEKAKTTDVFMVRCIVTLADGNEVTMYKGKDSCYALGLEYGEMTYEQYQEVKQTEFNNRINEAGENLGKMFIPDFLAVYATSEENDTNQTGLTDSQKFGATMQLVESIPWICEVEDKSDIMEEACILQEKYK